MEQSINLERLLEQAHQYLGLDVVFVVELAGEGYVCRAVAGDLESSTIAPAANALSMDPSGGARVSSEIANAIQDAVADERLARLPLVGKSTIGSFIGVPLHLSDGTLWGMLCCLSREPDRGLGERDVRFMCMLGELVADGLDQTDRSRRAELLALIESEEVTIAYQPIFDLGTGRCLGVEALARFRDPFTNTERTFELAEELGLGLQLEELVVRQAWTALPRLRRGQFLALNLTPESLLALARRAHRRQDVALSGVVVEITEHRAIEAYADLRHELERLRTRGLRIAVDDVGAGYASLRHVLELRPDIVKVDRWLIHGLADDRARRIAVNSFVSLARDLGSLAVAEGVELPADRDAARELGLHAAQGYLLARPSTEPSDFAKWTTTRALGAPTTPAARRPTGAKQRRPQKVLTSS